MWIYVHICISIYVYTCICELPIATNYPLTDVNMCCKQYAHIHAHVNIPMSRTFLSLHVRHVNGSYHTYE